MDFSTWFVSVLRTAVPAGVGVVIAWLASLGLDAGAQANTGLTIGLTGLTIAGYYALVRAIEPKLPPWLRVLLIGANRQPEYDMDAGAPVSRARR